MGGSETYVRALLAEFAAGRGPDRVTALLNPRALTAYRARDGGPVTLRAIRSFRPGRRPPARAAAMLAGHAASRLVARELPPDLDLLHYPVTVPIPRRAPARRGPAARAPAVVTLHDVQHHDLPRFFSRAERSLRRLTYDAAARHADAVITPSEYARGRIVDVLGIPPERVHAVHHGIDHERLRPEPDADDERRLAPLRLERPFVVYPANLWPHKNHERLVDAFARLRDLDAELVLTGQTNGRLGPLLERARRARAPVRHLGYLDLGAMPALLRAARALVFPSLYEGFGGPPLEAMACGCPVASSTRTALAEVVGGAALPLEPDSAGSIADALRRVLCDEELRSRLADRGVTQARRFAWDATARRHTAIYGRVSATSGPLAH